MDSFKRKLLKELCIEFNRQYLTNMQNAIKILFITKLLNRVHDKCALCEEIKRLEYLAVDDQDNLYDICEDCKKRGERMGKEQKLF